MGASFSWKGRVRDIMSDLTNDSFNLLALLRHKHNNGRITGLAWAPNANRLVFVRCCPMNQFER